MSNQPQKEKKFDLADYVTVNQRVELFWKDHPNGRIASSILVNESGQVIFRCEVYREITDVHPAAVGHAMEKEGSTFINRTSHIENCETSAVGRALAMLGYEIQKSIASREEVENAKLNQDNQEEQKFHQEADKKQERNLLPDLKAKWQVLAGSLDGFDEFYAKQKEKYSDQQINTYLTKKLAAKKAEETGAGLPF